MDPFPEELWRDIIKNMRQSDWLVLSTTCRHFHSIAQAALYEAVSLRGHMVSEDNTRTVKFLETIVARPELGALVQSLRLISGRSVTTFGEHSVFPYLSHFTELRALELRTVDLDDRFFTFLHGGCPPHLTAISLIDCHLYDGEFTFGLSAFPSQISPNMVDVTPSLLKKLQIKAQVLSSSSMENTFSEFIRYGTTQGLTRLSFGLNLLPSNIVLLLQSAPQLRRLSFPNVRQNTAHVISTLPTDAVPLLEHFWGPAEYCGLFLGGRPVYSVYITLLEKWECVEASLSLPSTVPITRIKFIFPENSHVGDSNITIVNQVPVTLRHLSWAGHVTKENVMSWLPALSRLKDLETIEGMVHNPIAQYYLSRSEAKNQEELVQAISGASSSIRKIIFPWIREGNHNWRRWNDGHWERYAEYDC